MNDSQQRFEALYREHASAILAYAVRRADHPEDAADVVADVFLVAWRRIDDVPDSAQARLWLFGVARRAMSSGRRSRRRASRLTARLRDELAERFEPDPAVAVSREQAVRAALRRLAPVDRDIVTLSTWEQLSAPQIATVLGLSPDAVRKRLSRARTRLAEDLGTTFRPALNLTEETIS